MGVITCASTPSKIRKWVRRGSCLAATSSSAACNTSCRRAPCSSKEKEERLSTGSRVNCWNNHTLSCASEARRYRVFCPMRDFRAALFSETRLRSSGETVFRGARKQKSSPSNHKHTLLCNNLASSASAFKVGSPRNRRTTKAAVLPATNSPVFPRGGMRIHLKSVEE
ncbi:MAG: hypothetical protein BWX80_03163 [Candidatus Hydrogenedentes bacterium ADurb.Bin101]|nr:MAG: hypothetical protein BWX80_03163 [Candidatus Hydrogenedentes bacterium ADurb.Bin101]